MKKYQRLTFPEREDISRMIASGQSLRQIALILDRSASTITREVNRCVVIRTYYRAYFAQGRANRRRHKIRTRKLTKNHRLRRAVLWHLTRKWSPEQIANRLKMLYSDDMTMQISHEAIYSYIYILPRGTLKLRLVSYLRRSHKHRRSRRGTPEKHVPVQDFLSIEERPAEAANRTVPGHWEGDLIVGKRNASAIGTLVERTTRMTFIVKLNNQDAITIRKAFSEEFRQLPQGLKKSLTYDQGGEMAQHKLFTKETNITVYFAHPRSPWERGTNENTNGLIRQYFPKGTDFNKIPKSRVKKVQDELNDRPRKTLQWFTPHEKFSELLR